MRYQHKNYTILKEKKSNNFLSKHEDVKINKLCKNNRDASPQGGIKSKDWERCNFCMKYLNSLIQKYKMIN